MENSVKDYLEKGYITPEEAAKLIILGYDSKIDDCTMDDKCNCKDCQSEHWSFGEYGRA